MKVYNVPMDSQMKTLVLTALMEKAHQRGISPEAKNNYLQCYYDIQESIIEQEK